MNAAEVLSVVVGTGAGALVGVSTGASVLVLAGVVDDNCVVVGRDATDVDDGVVSAGMVSAIEVVGVGIAGAEVVGADEGDADVAGTGVGAGSEVAIGVVGVSRPVSELSTVGMGLCPPAPTATTEIEDVDAGALLVVEEPATRL